jgi:hypothetical protein
VQQCARVGTAQLTHNNTAIDKRLQHIGAQRSGIAQPTVVKTSPGLDQHQCASLVFERYRNSQRSASTIIKKVEIGPSSEKHGEHVSVAHRSGRMTSRFSVSVGPVNMRIRSQKNIDNFFPVAQRRARAQAEHACAATAH